MQKIFLLLFLLISLKLMAGGDSLTTVKINESLFILHHVSAKETFYSISRRYDVPLENLFKANAFIKDSVIAEGMVLKVPVSLNKGKKKETALPPAHFSGSDSIAPSYHEVKAGETLYAISRRYEGVGPDLIRNWNELKGDTIKIGQQLIVGWSRISKQPVEQVFTDTTATAQVSSIDTTPAAFHDTVSAKPKPASFEQLYLKNNSQAARETVETGMATWIPIGGNTEANKMLYALHKTAPTGTILKVRNLMNSKVIYVKVIGKVPDTAVNENVLLTLSGFAARELGVLDPRFRVEVRYWE